MEVTGGETGDLTIATDAELLGSGLEEQLTNFLSDHPETKFVIIDTLQKIRQLKADSYSYAGDYATLTVLKQIADRFDLTILLVHHTRKPDSSSLTPCKRAASSKRTATATPGTTQPSRY